MMVRGASYIIAISTLLFAGCAFKQPATAPVSDGRPAVSRTGQEAPVNADALRLLQLGLQQYDNGFYRKASGILQQSIDAGLPPEQRTEAHKHLAFIYCVTKRENLCRNEFDKALAVDPKFELSSAEIGHPQWGPVFRSAKAGR